MKGKFILYWVCAATFFIHCTAEPVTLGVSPLAGTVFINEFMASNSSVITDESGDYDDWLELYNDGTEPVNVGAMYLTDDFSRPMRWEFPDTVIPGKGYLIIWTDGETNEGTLHTSFKLKANPGEQIGLYTTNGERLLLIDTLSFGLQKTDTSYGRIPDGGTNWQFLSIPTPGAKNTTNISEFRDILFINEFMASNSLTITDEFGDYDDWVEIYNAGPVALMLGNMYLTDDFTQPMKWVFPDTVIPANGFVLVWADNESGEGPMHAEFSLAAALGEQLGLFEKNGSYVLFVDTVSFGHQGRDTSYGRITDGGQPWQFFTSPTPGQSNHTKGRHK